MKRLLFNNGQARKTSGDYTDVNTKEMNDELTTTSSRKPRSSSNYFNDGKRKIDYVLVWNDCSDDTKLNKSTQYHRKYRTTFTENLQKEGVQFEEEVDRTTSTETHYLKLHVPWDVMCKYAQLLRLRAPIERTQGMRHCDWSATTLRRLSVPNIMLNNVPNPPEQYYTCQFMMSKLKNFIGSDDPESYFNEAQRHQVAYEILATQPYVDAKDGRIGIDRLVEEDVYAAAYVLHDGPYQVTEESLKEPTKMNRRQILYWYWAKWCCWYKYQPLDHIRQYYGEKIGFYFAWLGLYTAWLLPAACVGIAVFLYGLFTMNFYIPAKEACSSSIVMCPMCDESQGCQYWHLRDVCFYLQVSYLFDHPGTVFFAIFMVIWGVSFLEAWKRKCARLAHHWDVWDYEVDEERPRPQYSALCSEVATNPITGEEEPHFPNKRRLIRVAAGLVCILLMIVLVIIFIMAVIIYRLLILIPLFKNEFLRPNAGIYATMSAAVVNLVLIMCLGKVYDKLAYKMTQWEMHRTQSSFENQLIFKVFLFQFVNFYASIFYVAFFKGRFVGYPGNYTLFFGLRNESCNNGGCLIELAQQLLVIMIGKQLINNCQELLVPKLQTMWHKYKRGLFRNSASPLGSVEDDSSSHLHNYTEDFKLIAYEGLFDEYLEMVLQYGFITIFVAAFPLAPFFALINNWIEIRLDAQKLVCQTRRPLEERAQNIGVWFRILDFLVRLAVISNALIIAFTSQFLPKLLYKYEFDDSLSGYMNFTLAWAPPNSTSRECRYADFRDPNGHYSLFFWKLLALRLTFVLVFEHVAFILAGYLDFFIPDIPADLEDHIGRERFLGKRALIEAQLDHPRTTDDSGD